MARPPHDAERLRAYLDEIDRTEAMGTAELLDTVAELLNNWTLGAREDAALVRVLADAKGCARPERSPTGWAGRGRRTCTRTPHTPRAGCWSSTRGAAPYSGSRTPSPRTIPSTASRPGT
ncbi:hypothetical protein O1M63_08100 [Streptomyces mirabilis]|nr:hypothetical protein [Streptomyces mirabilis]